MTLVPTASQTVGPFFAIGLQFLASDRVPMIAAGEPIAIEGRVLDGAGVGVADALLEIWQADPEGSYLPNRPSFGHLSEKEFPGFARVPTSAEGKFQFTTVKPGRVIYDDAQLQAPHLLVLVYMRGLMRNLVTRMYFPGEPSNADDPVLKLMPEHRRSTLIAESSGPAQLCWDIRLRGQQETVFFAW